MLAKSLLLAPVLLSLVLESTAAPSPKRPEIKYPKLKRPGHLAKREALENNVLQNTKRWYSAPSIKAPRTNIWAALSNAEAAAVIAFLHEKSDLSLTASDLAGAWDNQISVVETLPVNKTDATPYLENGGQEPERWARVSIMFGATESPYVEDYKVGPLPTPTTYEPLGYTSTKGSSKMPNYDADSGALYDYIYTITSDVKDIVQDLCNGTATGADNDTLSVWGIDPLWQEEGRIVNWLTFWREDSTGSDGGTLLPQGLYFKIDMTGRDPSKWSFIGWLYNDIYYTSTADFRAAWSSPNFEKAGVHNIPDEHVALPGFKEEDSPPLDVKPHPFPIQPAEARFEVDYDAQYVTWMDFSFYVAFGRDRGVRLFDIKYKGERVMYELGLEEAIATYAGNDPMQSGTAYLDTYYGFGPYAFALLPGYDCPSYATFLNSTFHVDEQSKTHRNSICLFEFENDYPTQRHTNSEFVSVTRNVVFQLRSVSTVGNYDYMFTYTFQRDGTIEVTVRASGYIQSAYYLKNDEYGYKIHDALSGSMHDHVLTFKADLDILGTKNTLAKHQVLAVQQDYSWSNYTRSTMKLFRSDIETEDDGKLMWGNASMYIVENKDAKNKYGEYRGWRVKPGLGMGHHLTMTNSSNLFDSQNFATHHLYVTKQSDNEPHCAHANNNYDTKNPIVDFNKFFDGESLQQEDLVLWVNLGMTHVPHTGDLPNTVFNTAQSSVQFSPHNYLLADPSRNVHHQIKVNYNPEGVQSILQYGENPSGNLDLADTVPKLWNYQGDIAIRKFPFDPSNPFNDTESI